MNALFTHLSSPRIAALIRTAKKRVCYAAPGIQMVTAQAIAELAKRLPADELTISLDFNESSLRMGYGSLEAVKLLASAGIDVRNSPGLRSAFLIVDSAGWVFTPTALYMEPEPQSDETPNALALGPEQISEVLLRVSSTAREEAIALAITPEEKAAIETTAMEIGEATIDDARLAEVTEAIRQAPPVAFDLARQVRVFQPYLQYVELELTGAKIQSHRTRIPRSIQTLGSGKDLEGKLRTTFQLIGTASKRRVAFGRSGKGRHGAFCFANVYHVETWRDGALLEVRVERTDGGQTPFLCVIEREGDRTGHGTQIRADVEKNLLPDAEVRELIGSKFAVDPTFEILVNREAIKLLELKGLVTTEIPVDGFGNIIVHRIDSEIQDRTSQLRGITWWVNKRTVGGSSWEGLDGEGAYLDGRTSLAKRYSFVVEADILKKQVKDDWTGFRASPAFHSVRDSVHKYVVTALNEIQASSRKERKKAALAQTRTVLKELTPLSQNAVATFVEQVQEKCPTLSERDLFRTVEIYTKLERARSGYDLLKQLQECSPQDLDAWNQIMQRWTAGNAEIILSELDHRLKLIERLQSLVDSSKADELHDLQPLFERGLWMFGPEYDAVDFHSNRYLATIIRDSLGGTSQQVAHRRPDFVAFPDRSIGIYSAAAYENQGEISGIRQILVVELKKGGFELSQKELDQARDYSKELYKSVDVRADTKTVAYVLGAKGEEGLGEATYSNRITIVPMLYRTLLDRAHSRTFNLQRQIEQLGLAKPVDEQLEEVLSSAEQPELEPRETKPL